MRVANCDLVWSTDQSSYTADGATGDISNTTLYSQPISLRHLNEYAIQCVLTGATVVGSLKLQCSNDNPNVPPDVGFPSASSMNWTDITGSSATFAAAGSQVWNAQGVGYLWVRVVWSETSATTGTIDGVFNGKGPA